jgi:hypothetical protein
MANRRFDRDRCQAVIAGAAHFRAMRKGFFFTGGGLELPVVWCLIPAIQALLGDGLYAAAPSLGSRSELKLG